jgi:hypothetical protein
VTKEIIGDGRLFVDDGKEWSQTHLLVVGGSKIPSQNDQISEHMRKVERV